MTTIFEKLGTLFVILYGVLLVATYPLALLPLESISLAYNVSVPSLFVLTLCAIPVLIASPFRPGRFLSVAIGLYFLPLLYNAANGFGKPVASVEMSGYMIVPLAIAAIACGPGSQYLGRLCVPGFILWVSQILHGFVALRQGFEAVGFPGNRNWMASFVLALSPWAFTFAHRRLYRLPVLQRRGRGAAIAAAASFFIVAVPTAYILLRCASRGAWLALIVLSVLCLLRCIPHCSRRLPTAIAGLSPVERAAAAFFLCVILTCSVLLVRLSVSYVVRPEVSAALIDAIKSDVRLPLWGGTVQLISDNDALASLLTARRSSANDAGPHGKFGIGAGRFREAFTVYRSKSTYHERHVAAPVTVHPHNEFLSVAAQLGILAACAWLAGLVPVLTGVTPAGSVLNCARFSAFVIIFHGFFDLTLVQPPVNLLAFAMLGLCWQRLLQPLPPVDDTALAYQWRRSAVSLASLAALGISVHFGARNLRADWSIRNGIVDEHRGKYRQAFHAYVQAIELEPGNIRPYLLAASVATSHLGATKSAYRLLHEAYAMDPNFAHINSEMGKLFGMLGDHEAALAFFIHECRLYPRSTKAYQNYYLCLILNGEFDRLPAVSAYLDQLYAADYTARYGISVLHGPVLEWQTAVGDGQIRKAIDAAEKACGRLNRAFVDPMYHALDDHGLLASAVMRNDYNPIDFDYWQQIHTLHSAIAGIRDGAGRTGPSALADLVKQFHGYIVLDESIEDFYFPSRVWKRRTCNPLSGYCFISAVARQCGLTPLIQFDAEDKPDGCILVDDDRSRYYRVDLLHGTVLPVSRAPDIHMASGVLLVEGRPVRLFFFPQEFWLKNQILGTLHREFGGDDVLQFDRIPVQILSDLVRTADAAETTDLGTLRKLCLQEPFAALATKVQ